MNTTKKILFGLGIASGAILAAWLVKGDRGQKTKSYIARRVRALKNTPQEKDAVTDDSEIHYL